MCCGGLRLIKVYPWVVRFGNNCCIDREHRIIGELTVNEIIDSEKQIIKNAQKEVFLDEFVALQKDKPLPTTSKLCPKLDEDRCDSQLQYAEFLLYDVRCRIILPRGNYITKLIVKHYHEIGNHAAGTNQTLAAREEIKDWETACKKRKAKCARQVMAPLPLNWLKASLRAFFRTAVDFAGPFVTIQGRAKQTVDFARPFVTIQGRGKQWQKRYLCLFTCLATRTIHLEVAYGLNIDSFMRAFCRMCNRHGVPEELLSDNAANFVGASQKLCRLREQLLKDRKKV